MSWDSSHPASVLWAAVGHHQCKVWNCYINEGAGCISHLLNFWLLALQHLGISTVTQSPCLPQAETCSFIYEADNWGCQDRLEFCQHICFLYHALPWYVFHQLWAPRRWLYLLWVWDKGRLIVANLNLRLMYVFACVGVQFNELWLAPSNRNILNAHQPYV